MKRIFVLGSINMDLVMETERMPQLGESVIGNGFMANQGGKGANQAVACAKLGANCTFLGAIGDDEHGQKLISSLKRYGVGTDGVQYALQNSGTCMILFDKSRHDNLLVVDLGANMYVDGEKTAAYLREHARSGDVLITQLEINTDAIAQTIAVAKQIGMMVVLNPAPAREIGQEILRYVDLIIPNETEATALSGIAPDTEENVLAIYNTLGVAHLIITLGKRGSVYVHADRVQHYAARIVQAVDTTAAGDTFIGALCAEVCDGADISQAIEYATACSAITVSRRGAAVSIPTAEEVKKYISGE